MQNPEEKIQSPKTTENSIEKEAGRGFLMITGAKAWFMVGGASITFGLPFVFSMFASDGRQLYGKYYDINNTLSIFSMVLIGGLLPAVSRYAASSTLCQRTLLRAAKRVALCLGFFLLLLFALGGQWYAATRGHAELSLGYVAAGVICFAYALYAVNVGFLNGQKKFKVQAGLDIIFTTMKVTFVLGAALVGFGVLGAFVGFAIAAVLIALISQRQLRDINAGDIKPGGFLAFAGWLMLYTLAFNLAFKVDAILLRPLFKSMLENDIGADQLMGEYGIAVSLSRLPWQSTIALTFVIFPMISEATFVKDLARTQRYIANTIRYALLLICMVAIPLVARPDLVFDCLPGYTQGGFALRWLAPAYVLFSLSNLHNTILMSSGHAKMALGLMILNLVLVIASFKFGITHATDGASLMRQAGQMTLLAFAVVASFGGFIIQRRFNSYAPIWSCIRIASIVSLIAFVSNAFQPTIMLTKLAFLGSLPLVFCILLWLSGELNAEDKARFCRVFKSRKRS